MAEPVLGTLNITDAATGAATLTYDSDSATADGSLVVLPGGLVVFQATDSGDQDDLEGRSVDIADENAAD